MNFVCTIPKGSEIHLLWNNFPRIRPSFRIGEIAYSVFILEFFNLGKREDK